MRQQCKQGSINITQEVATKGIPWWLKVVSTSSVRKTTETCWSGALQIRCRRALALLCSQRPLSHLSASQEFDLFGRLRLGGLLLAVFAAIRMIGSPLKLVLRKQGLITAQPHTDKK